MKSFILFVFLVFGMSTLANAQSKKDLLAEIDKLRAELSTTKSELNVSRTNERVSKSKVETMEIQVKTLEETNNSILSKMGGFTQLSQQKSKNLEQSLETIKKKDAQLNTVNEELTKADSTKLATVAIFKNGLGDSLDREAKLGIIDGAVYLTMDNVFLFGEGSNLVIQENAKNVLSKIAAVLNARLDLDILIEGNSNELTFSNGLVDNWDLSSLRAAAIARALQTENTIDPKRIQVVGKSQYSLGDSIETSTRIMISPKFDEFFLTIKESMKN